MRVIKILTSTNIVLLASVVLAMNQDVKAAGNLYSFPKTVLESLKIVYEIRSYV